MMRQNSPPTKPRHVFVVGLHRSGTSILAELLKQHPQIAGHTIVDMPPELENEGQHVQRVFPPDDALGGPGFFAFNPLSHLTESSALATAESAAQLDAEWGAHWSSDAAFVLEKSPSSLLRMRLLQKLYPDAYFVVILRHPIANAYATQTWGLAHGGKNSLPNDAVVGFVDHWLHAHKIVAADLSHVKQCRCVQLEQLAGSPQSVLDAICADLGVPTYPVPADKVSAGVNRKYAREWRNEAKETRTRIESLVGDGSIGGSLMARFGYSAGDVESAAAAAADALSSPMGSKVSSVGHSLEALGGGGGGGGGTASGNPETPEAGKRQQHFAANGNGGGGNGEGGSVGAGAKRSAAVAAEANGGGALKVARSSAAQTASSRAAAGVKRPLILTFGTRGDVQPFLPLALEMKSRGMAPLIVTLPIFRPLVEEAGIDFASIVPDNEAAPPRVDDAREAFFLDGVAQFYDAHGDEMVECVEAAVTSHKADSILVGSLIFFLKWLRSLHLPLVHTRFSPYAAKEGESNLQAHANDVVHFLSIARSYGLVGSIAKEAAIPDKDLLGAIMDMKNEPTLLAYAKGCEAADDAIPGLPMVRTGFWLTAAPSGFTPPAGLATFLNKKGAAAAGDAPICLNFGSMAVYQATWAKDLLAAVKATGKRLVAVGDEVPTEVRGWPNTYWIKSVPHAYLFPKCACIIHHGGAGTTAAAAASGRPSVVVPFLGWSDQPRFGVWAERAGAGVQVPEEKRTVAGFSAALEAALAPAAAAAAAAVGKSLAQEQGAASAVDAIESLVTKQPTAEHKASMELLESLQALPLSDGGKLRAGLYILLREPSELPLQTYKARDTWLKALGKQLVEFPLYKPDWPPLHKPLDLAVHDLPHKSSLIEWWYFHAHLKAADGTPYCVFVALFQLKLGGETLSHVHASLLLEGKRHVYYTAGEPHAAESVIKHRHPKHDEYFERALLECFAKHHLPAPDVASASRFAVPDDEMRYDCDRVHMSKDETTGTYYVSVDPSAVAAGVCGAENGAGFGFELSFSATKPPVRNGIDGVSPGVANDDAMFYYSITRMQVEGKVLPPAEGAAPVPVTGQGWYDHEFGGDSSRGSGGGGIKVMDVAWAWTGVQLDDGTEVTYAKTVDNLGAGTLVDKAILIGKDGSTSKHDATLNQLSTWTSLETFIAYGKSWKFSVPSEGLELEMAAVVDGQELISVISTPAYWEGQVYVKGTKHGRPITGNGFVEQYYGSQNQNFRTMLQAVSDVVLRNVDAVFPYEPTPEHVVKLVVSNEFEHMMEGLPTDVFVNQLVRPVRDITDRQGKGWRSMGLLLASSVVGGDAFKLERYTSFPEFLHTGSLIIDDIQDNSLLRRGGPCAHVTYGIATAINAGTAAYFLGEGITRETPNLTEHQRLRVYELYFTCLRGAHVGQALDINGMNHMMDGCLASGDFEPMWKVLLCCHRLKSGLPASICARTGAVLGRATVEQEAALGDYFLSMGLAFQVIDDVINLQGFGKSLKTKAEDLIEGKITAPVIRCMMLMRGQPERQRWLWEQYSVPKESRDIGGMVEMIEQSGAFEQCIKEAHGMVDEAWKAVDATVPDSFAKVCLRAFGWFVCKVRDY